MPETNISVSHLESPAAGTTLPQGRHLLRCWVWPKAGGHFVDVRARVGPRVFPGVHGLPRADLAAHFKTGTKFALAEFYVAVELLPGSREIALEVLEIDGRWSVFQKAGYQVVATQPAADIAVPGAPLRWIDYCHGLQRLLRAAGSRPDQPLPDLAATLAGEIAYPRDLRYAPAPLLGFVDEPASVACCRFGRIPAFGHLFHPTLRTRRILGTLDLQSWQPLPHHQPSPGPAAFYPQYPNAQACGFVGFVDVAAQLPNPVCLRIYVELEDDSLHLCQVVQTRLHPVEEEKIPYLVQQPGSFDAVLDAWDHTLATHGIAVDRNVELDRRLAALREDYLLHAPRNVAPPSAPLRESPATSTAPLPKCVILATHGLSLQGAPRFLLEYGRFLAAMGVQLHVVAAEDGPLHAEFAALGAKVTVVDIAGILHAADAAAFKTAMGELTKLVDWSATDLVVANSFTTFWAVLAAHDAGRPVLLYVHESTTPAIFYGQRFPAQVTTLAETAIALADAVSFTTESTRRYHLGYGRPERHCLTPGWVDVAALDAWLAKQNRNALRQRFGLRPDELLVCNIGTVSDRKGQHTFARAVDLLWRRHPALAARTRFILLGGRDSPFDTMLHEALAELGRTNIVVHPETSDYLPYYLAADVFACSSYEESSPKVVFEAMACRTPIIASAVHGIPELVRPDTEALLLPAGDTAAWCEGLARLLAAPAIGRELAARARTRMENRFDAKTVLLRHAALASDVAARKF
jgi:glycosyltransferase involved in cell wall biosynthesis